MHRAIAVALVALVLALVVPAAAGAASFPANATLVASGQLPDLLTFPADGSGAFFGSVSSDGRYVAYEQFSVVNGMPVASIVRRDLLTGQTTPVNVAEDGSQLLFSGITTPPRISGDGQHVAFAAFDPGLMAVHLYVRDLSSSPPRTLIADRFADTGAIAPSVSTSSTPSISDDGSRVEFASSAQLDPLADRDNKADIYVRDLKANQTFLVDRAAGELGAKASGTQNAEISGDGHSVVFDVPDPLDSSHDSGTDRDVYVRNLDTFTTTLASVAGASDKGNGDAFAAGISRDGNRVLLASSATTFGVTDGSLQLYVRDIRAHTLELASRADGPAVVPVSTLSSDTVNGALSADGRHVVWVDNPSTSIAPGAPGDSKNRTYERDLSIGTGLAGATRLISRSTGAGGAAGVDDLSGGDDVTADGGCVAFSGDESLLTPPAAPKNVELFMRVLEPDCGRTAPGPGPGPGPGPVGPALLSGLSLKPSRFFVGGSKGGTRVAFRLDKGASVTLSFDRLLAGRLKGKRCVTTARTGKRCTVVRRAGHMTVAHGRAGANTVKFSGKLGRHALAPGTYRLTATPLHGRAVTVRFVVVKAPKPKRKARR